MRKDDESDGKIHFTDFFIIDKDGDNFSWGSRTSSQAEICSAIFQKRNHFFRQIDKNWELLFFRVSL